MGLESTQPNPCFEMKKMKVIDFEVISFSSGYVHFSCIDSSGNLYACGYNHLIGRTFDVNNKLTKLMEGTKFVSCYCGGDFTTAIDQDGNLYGIGFNRTGELGKIGEIKEAEKLDTSHCGKQL